MSAADLFASLAAPPPTGGRSYTAAQVEPGLRIAKGEDGRAAILAASGRETRAPILMRHLRVDFGATCHVLLNDKPVSEEITIVECTSDDPSVMRHFLLAVTAALGGTESPSPGDVVAAIQALVEAFRAMAAPPLMPVQGLWGELFMIYSSPDAAAMISAWHVSAHDRHDFAADGQRLEVKTAGGRHRRHRFAHEQLATDDCDVVIASLQLESAADGLTIADMVREISTRRYVDGDLRLRLLQSMTAGLGDRWEIAERDRFDALAARRSLRFFSSSSVPQLDGPIPAHVTEVKYTVDLAGAPSLESADLRRHGGLFAAAVPDREVA